MKITALIGNSKVILLENHLLKIKYSKKLYKK
jgi:hypothetical protein